MSRFLFWRGHEILLLGRDDLFFFISFIFFFSFIQGDGGKLVAYLFI